MTAALTNMSWSTLPGQQTHACLTGEHLLFKILVILTVISMGEKSRTWCYRSMPLPACLHACMLQLCQVGRLVPA
jgi:hypothetical protein